MHSRAALFNLLQPQRRPSRFHEIFACFELDCGAAVHTMHLGQSVTSHYLTARSSRVSRAPDGIRLWTGTPPAPLPSSPFSCAVCHRHPQQPPPASTRCLSLLRRSTPHQSLHYPTLLALQDRARAGRARGPRWQPDEDLRGVSCG